MNKPRSALGQWLDERGISQEWIVKESGVSRNTVSRLSSANGGYEPSLATIKKLMKAIHKIDSSARVSDFFDI